jgi:hypothetical protein
MLMQEFEINPSPTKKRIHELSDITSIDELTIMTWFRNRRYISGKEHRK